MASAFVAPVSLSLPAPPPIPENRQKLIPREPVKTNIHRVPIQIPLPIILQPMRRPQNTPEMSRILLLHPRLIAQILQHILCLNPFPFHNKSHYRLNKKTLDKGRNYFIPTEIN